jgi:hypothetical protein
MSQIDNIQYSLIPFNGEEIIAITKENKKYVIPKQICENLGIDWSSQRQRINRDTVLSDTMVMTTIPQKNPSGAGFIDQETLILPLEYLNGWLFGIDDTRVKEEVRQKVIDYKKHCYLVLYEFFQKGASIDIDRLD